MPLVGGGSTGPAPQAPTLVTPANFSYQDVTSGFTFYWVYNPSAVGTTQSSWAMRMKISGSTAYSYYNNTSHVWQSALVLNSGSVQDIAIPNSGFFQNGVNYTWSVSTVDANGQGPFATDFTLVTQTAPSVSVTAPTGTIITSQPTVTWAVTTPAGVTQATYQVCVYTAAQYGAGGFSPGVSAGAYVSTVIGSAYVVSLPLSNPPDQPPVFLANSTTYRSYVQVSEFGGQLSAWAYHPFTTSWTAPDAPTITATATNDPSTGCPMIQLYVVGAEFDSMAPKVIIQRSDGLYVRGASLANPGQLNGSYEFTLNDYEIEQTVSYTYTATLVVVVSSSSTVVSPPTTSSAAVVPAQGWWEVNPLNPAMAANAQLITYTPTVNEQSSAHLVMGQAQPNVIANVMGLVDGTGVFETFSAAVYNALQALLQSQQTVFIQCPFGPLTGINYVRFGPQTGALSTGTGNVVKTSALLPSTAAQPHQTTDVSWVAAIRPTV